MTRRYPLVALVLLGLLSASLQGCAYDPRSRYLIAVETANTTRKVITQGWASGVIDDATFVALDPYEKAVRGSLDRVKPLLLDPDADPATIDYQLDLAESVLEVFAEKEKGVKP